MAAFHHHRILQNESIEDSITSFCTPYCQPEKNQLGLCPLTCISYCYPICHRPFLVAIPPPHFDNPATTTTTTSSAATTITTFDGHSHPDDDRHYISSRFLALSLTVLVIGFFFFFCYSVCRFCSAWLKSRNEASEEEENPSRGGEFLDDDQDLDYRRDQVYHPIWYITSVGLQPSVINSITTFEYKKGNGVVEGTNCAVCLNEFQQDETLRLLPKCNHAFHIPCIDKWLESHTNCPICRADIVMINPVVSSSPVQNVVENPGAAQEEIQEGNPGNVENPGGLEKFQEGVLGNDEITGALVKIQEGVSGNAGIPGALEKIQKGVSVNIGNPGVVKIIEERVSGNVESPGALKKIQEGVPGIGLELETEKDSESCKSSAKDEHEAKSNQEVIGALQPLRRSVSGDSLSATDDAFPALSDKQVNKESFPSKAEKMKRSLSFSEKQILEMRCL